MSIRSRLASIFSRKAAEEQADAPRPGLSPIDMLQFGLVQPVLFQAYVYHENCSLLCDIDITLQQETFRNGIEVEPRFALKCRQCGHELQEEADKCPSCASSFLDPPMWAQMRFFEHLDGTTFLERANDSGQTLQEVCEHASHHLHVADNAYLLAVCSYLFDEQGNVKESYVMELLSLDPRWVEKIFDKYGRPGGRHRLCLAHRNALLGPEQYRCPVPGCGKPTHDVTYKVITANNGHAYYVDDEICHLTEFYPHPLYGTPPVYKIRMEVEAYMHITGRIAAFYKKGRPPGFVAVRTDNPKSIDETIAKINLQLKEDPSATPYFPVPTGLNGGSGEFIKFVQFMPDPCGEWVKVKDEVRRAICAFYNIPPMVESDTQASGGLNDEGHQITLLNRRTEKDQRPFNGKAFPWMFRKFGITDLKLVLNKAEQNDEKLDLEVQLLKDQHAQNRQNMGFEVSIKDGEYEFSDKPTEKRQPQLFAAPQVQEAGATEGEPANKGDEAPFELVRYTGNEDVDAVLFADSMADKAFVRVRASDIIRALLHVTVPNSFAELSPTMAQSAMERLVDAMTQAGGWSVSGVVEQLRAEFPGVDAWQLRRIVRTESARIATRAHELEAVENDPPAARYTWRGPRDWRTCRIHQAIMERQPAEGLPLEELKALVKKVAAEFGVEVQDDWIVHPNQRGSFSRKFGGAA